MGGGGDGGHKFKLSDLIPNAWFLKIKNMKKKEKKKPIITQNLNPSDKLKNTSPPPSLSSSSTSTTTTITSSNTFSSSSSSSSSHGRTSLYFKRDHISSIQSQNSSQNPISSNTHLLKSPRKSTRRTRNRVLISSPRRRPVNAGTGCTCHITTTDSSVKKIKPPPPPPPPPTIKDSSFIEIPPIVTKKVTHTRAARSTTPPVGLKRVSVSSPGVKLRIHSPRISMSMTRRCNNNNNNNNESPRWRGRRSLAVVKSSMNPQKDFKESMVEMIVENDIKSGKDLEDLLACYLELNSNGYHDLIIKVFKQIWFDLNLKM
ncbi:transcription repressor OFP1-like [Impatiens glandulifera]|uniref:transcription repressor OFP1-like n=1 Tax=Impatiens glandulifera TaxID=253017 RepID=UPI001FB19F7A|nr:transcription repressor OFP1-like [Impatiens glandulifera]